MRKSLIHIVSAIVMLFVGSNAFSQKATAITDRQTILLGEQIQLQVKLEGLPTGQLSVAQWFNLPDTFNHLEVVNRLKIDTVDVNGTHTYIQNILITGFDSGRWSIPALTVYVADRSGQTGKALQTLPITVDVLPVDVSEMQDYNPIKDIIDVSPAIDWWLWIGIGLGVIVLLLIVWWIIKRSKNKTPKAIKEKLSPSEEAFKALNALSKDNESLSNKEFYSRLDEIYRRYFTRALNFDAMKLTADELMLRLKVNLTSNEQQTEFFQLIRLVSAVKFAKFQPNNTERSQSISATERIVRYVEQTKGGAK